MKIDHLIHNFRVVNIRPLEELDCQIYELRYEKNGARLVWLDRNSENKTFGIGFRTIPSDDTGVFHILEHSVLCGSESYPVKEPFVDLLKGSMKTFLNAFTFPDKTFYPVSSRNDQDFANLMRVYLDAVFFPAIYTKPEIFRQEGWHYELRQGQPPSIKGVVFNEMKGALSSPDALMRNALNRAMFPDTCYRFVSGGDPAHIPELTYEQFLDAHRHFYHPSNAYIFLDGNVDLDGVLSLLDACLGRFDHQEMDTAVPHQRPVQAGKSVGYFALSAGEKPDKKARVALGFGLGDYTSRREVMAMQVIGDLLCGSNQAPLKQALLSAGLAENVGFGVMNGIRQNYVVLSADNLEEGKLEQLKETAFDVLRRQVRDGMDHAHLRSILANLELQYRERDYGYMPQGLGLGMDVMGSWLYGGDPAQNLTMGPLFAELNSLVDEGWYEQLLKKTIFANDHTCEVLLLPSHTLAREKLEAENARLTKAGESWDEALLLAQQASLDAWQASTDSPEDVAKLPKLTLSDISEKPEDIPTQVDTVKGVTVLRHGLPTGGISYWNLYFDISDFTEEELSAASFLCVALGSLATEQYTAMQLQKQTNFYTGKLHFYLNCYSKHNAPETCKTYLSVSFSALEKNLPQAIDLVLEILNRTRFDSHKQLREVLAQCKTGMEQTVAGSGNAIGMKRVMAGVSAEGVVQECTGGYTYLQYLKQADVEALAATLEALCRRAVTAGRLTLSITGSQAHMPINSLLSGLAGGEEAAPHCALKPWGPRKEGIIIPANISFAAQGGLCPHSAHMQAAAQIASLAYLWNAVRVQGGAYGAGLSIADRGCGAFYSYRDPNAARSLEQFGATADFIRDLAASGQDLTGFIIGTIAGTEPVLLPGKLGGVADAWYFKDVTYESRCAFRKSLLTMTAADLAALEAPLRALCESTGVCVVGSEAHVESCNLDQIHTL